MDDGSPPALGGADIAGLTVAQRILLHLSLFARHREAYEAPPEVTQKGIAGALELSRSHVALEVKKLVEEGSVETRLAHVAGARSRRKVYFPTFAGERVGAALRRRANAQPARWIDVRGEVRRGPGRDLFRTVRQRGRPLTPAYLRVLRGEVVDLRDRVPAPGEPSLADFVGRRAELARLRRWQADGPPVLVLTGLPGVGKTALARAFLAEAEGAWVRVFPFHTPASLLAALATALAGAGRPRLRRSLRAHPLDFAEAGLLLAREAADLLLALDDVSAAPEAARVLALLVDPPPPGSRLLLTARRFPDFLDPLRAAGTAEEVPLEGLPPEDTEALARRLGLRRPGPALHAQTRGHPLLVRLAAAAPGREAGEDPFVPFLEEVLRDLDSEEEEALFRAAVFRRPVPREALGVRFSTFRSLLRRGLLTGSGGRCEVHETVAPRVRRLAGDGLVPEHRRAARFWETARAWPEVVHHLAAAGRTEEAVAQLRRRFPEVLDAGRAGDLLELLDRLPPDPAVGFVRAHVLDHVGRWPEALAAAEEALAAADPGDAVRLLLLRGRVHSKRGDLDAAEEAFRTARDRAAREEMALEEGRARYHLGIVHQKRGDLAAAVATLEGALARFQELGARREAGRARMEMGVVCLRTGAYPEAVRWLSEAEPLLRDRKEDAAYLYTNLGMARARLEDPDGAAAAFETSRRLAAEAGLVRAEAHALANAADLLAEGKDLVRADAYARRALSAFETLRDPAMIAACQANRAKVAWKEGRHRDAEALYREGLGALEGVAAPFIRAGILREMSAMYRARGEGPRADRLQREATAALAPVRGVQEPPGA